MIIIVTVCHDEPFWRLKSFFGDIKPRQPVGVGFILMDDQHIKQTPLCSPLIICWCKLAVALCWSNPLWWNQLYGVAMWRSFLQHIIVGANGVKTFEAWMASFYRCMMFNHVIDSLYEKIWFKLLFMHMLHEENPEYFTFVILHWLHRVLLQGI